MTIEQHIENLKKLKSFHNGSYGESINAGIKALEQQNTGHWIEDAKTYYEELNKRGLGVDEYTPYFTDDIACSECLAKYSMLDNETKFFKHCPNCGVKMIQEKESEG